MKLLDYTDNFLSLYVTA